MLKKYLDLITHIAVAVLVGAAAFLLHSNAMFRMEKTHGNELKAQQAASELACYNDKQVTEKITHELQGHLSRVRTQLNILRNTPQNCVVPDRQPPSQHDGETVHAGLPAAYGITSLALREYAADAEIVGLQLDACQAYVRKVYYND